jgi:cellulose synthase/poly-beta-1,6-N-acetylglucosamine synthase-like glycosyltransferase
MVIDSTLLIVIHSAFLIILLHYLYFLHRVFKGIRQLKPSDNEIIPYEFVSIIIPFRNESRNLITNLKSIESQLYPLDKFEIIYVNDFSEDDSLELLRSNIKKVNIRVISVPEDYSKNAHKKRAIRYGIENARGEIIITTDADCVYDEEWLNSIMLSFDSLTGFVSGPVEFISDDKLFSNFQKLEFAGLVFCGAGLIGSGHPTICNAANIAYRKKVFDEVGGFKDQMNLSSGDDELLMQKISKDSDYKVKFCIEEKAIVKTAANKTIQDFIQQRKRWASKGLFYGEKSLVLKLILIYMFYVGLISQLILGLTIHQTFLLSIFISMLVKLIFEYQILSKGKEKILADIQLKYFFFAEVIQVPYIIYAGMIGAFGNYFWKSRKVKR